MELYGSSTELFTAAVEYLQLALISKDKEYPETLLILEIIERLLDRLLKPRLVKAIETRGGLTDHKSDSVCPIRDEGPSSARDNVCPGILGWLSSERDTSFPALYIFYKPENGTKKSLSDFQLKLVQGLILRFGPTERILPYEKPLGFLLEIALAKTIQHSTTMYSVPQSRKREEIH
ncbi:hypothetical protein J6590_096738 [Homalodisca vitripennis]|nr:hypothetical protein J6590_096738 [Homalodisca vitripennis]